MLHTPLDIDIDDLSILGRLIGSIRLCILEVDELVQGQMLMSALLAYCLPNIRGWASKHGKCRIRTYHGQPDV